MAGHRALDKHRPGRARNAIIPQRVRFGADHLVELHSAGNQAQRPHRRLSGQRDRLAVGSGGARDPQLRQGAEQRVPGRHGAGRHTPDRAFHGLAPRRDLLFPRLVGVIVAVDDAVDPALVALGQHPAADRRVAGLVLDVVGQVAVVAAEAAGAAEPDQHHQLTVESVSVFVPPQRQLAQVDLPHRTHPSDAADPGSQVPAMPGFSQSQAGLPITFSRVDRRDVLFPQARGYGTRR